MMLLLTLVSPHKTLSIHWIMIQVSIMLRLLHCLIPCRVNLNEQQYDFVKSNEPTVRYDLFYYPSQCT